MSTDVAPDAATADGTHGELLDTQEKIRKKVEETRNALYESKDAIIVTYLLKPLLAHTSHAIYAPFDACLELSKVATTVLNKARTGKRRQATWARLKEFAWNAANNVPNWCFLVLFIAGVYLMAGHSEEIKCFMQNFFLGWAIMNRSLSVPWRLVSISGMMMLRMVVSNVLPFTSPAFAFLIAKSMPPGELWAGSFFLLICSMPAGALVPCLDGLAYRVCCFFYSRRGRSEDVQVKHHFLATALLSNITDFLPFCFWVRPWFMEPAFAAAVYSGASDVGAAGAAVLAGHFMIWAGPATTMHQRRFAPDWLTCVVIQPIGLLEDVAVTLATWAGETTESQKDAEIALYLFMLSMNIVYFYTKRGGARQDDKAERIAVIVEHITVGLCTLIALFCRYAEPVEASLPTTTTTTDMPPLCATSSSNVQAITFTVAKVSLLAVLFQGCGFVANLAARKTAPRYTGAPRDLSRPFMSGQQE